MGGILEGTLLMLIGFRTCKWRTFGGDLVNRIQVGGILEGTLLV